MRGNWKRYACILAAVLLTVPFSTGIPRDAAVCERPVNNDMEKYPMAVPFPAGGPRWRTGYVT